MDDANMNIADLKKAYDDKAAVFNRKRKENTDDTPRELRKIGQELFSYANLLRKRYDDLLENGMAREGSKDYEEFKRERDLYSNELVNLSGWLKKYGSPMQGIPKTTFDDVAGLEDVKDSIKDYLYMLSNPGIAEAYHMDTNIGILLYGPPGTGKTLVAEAIANALNVRYFVITPSQIFGSYVGESEKNVRDIFEEMNVCTDGSVLLIDECEAIFARRDGNANRASIGVANQLHQEMNGQGEAASRRVIVGATNRPELMDEAYLRYKRFSLQFYIGLPNDEAKERVLDLNLKKRPCDENLRSYFLNILRGDDLYTCADISGIIEQCANKAIRECRKASETDRSIRYGENEGYIRINANHLDDVLAHYPRSVTREMLAQYEEFRDSRIKGL